MKKIAILALCSLLVTSCSQKIDTNSTNGVVKKGDTVSVDYVGKLQDGTIFDSSIKEFAKKSKGYSEQREYKPLEFTVGAGQMIAGFDKGVEGMKIGEKKTLTIAPADAYGEKTKTETVDIRNFQDKYQIDVEKEAFQDYVEQPVSKSDLASKIDVSNLKEGAKINVAEGVEATIKKIDGENVILSIKNTQNPFFGKKLVKGLTGTFNGDKVKILSIDDKSGKIKIEAENNKNIFKGKKLVAGLEAKTQDGEKIKIIEVKKEEVTIGVENSHELAGKTLIFDIELKDIKKTDTNIQSNNVNNKSDYVKTEEKPVSTKTVSQENALKKAKLYIESTAFSRNGLIKQLEYDGFTNNDAVYGVDNFDIDWNEQAAKKAKLYIESTAFSRNGLIKQLEYDGFTQSQAEHGANIVGL